MKLAFSAFLAAASICAVCVSARADIRRLHCIDDQKICRGAQPHGTDYRELARRGFKTVLDLRGGPVRRPIERKEVEAAGMHFICIRISGLFPPQDSEVKRVLAVLNDPSRKPIFVHCWRGADRPGVIFAAYRMTHDGWTNQQAYNEAVKDGLNPLEVLLQHYIKTFDPSKFRSPEPGAGSQNAEAASRAQ